MGNTLVVLTEDTVTRIQWITKNQKLSVENSLSVK